VAALKSLVATKSAKIFTKLIVGLRREKLDYAQLIKFYRASVEGEARYSPAEVAQVVEIPVMGRPDPARICTSIVECSNLSLRMSIPRFTRLTNAFSKTGEPLGRCCAVVCVLQLLPCA